MNEEPFDPVRNICVLADGTIVDGFTRIKPWPCLRMKPRRTLIRTRDILWANAGDPLWEFTRKIPPTLLAIVRRSPTNPWELLELIAAAPERGGELLRQCPALALLLARSCPVDSENRAEHYRLHLDCTWKEILAAVELPPLRRYVRVLRKLPLLHCREETLEHLACALRQGHPFIRTILHMRQITRDTVGLLTLPSGLVNSHLLLSSAKSTCEVTPITWRVESVAWLRELEAPGRDWPFGKLNAEELAVVEERLRKRLAEIEPHFERFPPPPLHGLPGVITPLSTYWDVVSEGRQQNNCASMYVDEIVSGDCYLYSVTTSERATLLLCRIGESSTWEISELKAEGNKAVSSSTQSRVEEWLRKENSKDTPNTKK